MERITTHTTFEQASFPVLFSYIPTSVTGLAGVVTVDQDNAFSKHLCFISDEAQKLSWTPTSNKTHSFGLPLGFSPVLPHLHSCYIQLFKGESIAITVDDCLRDAVICVSDKPSLSSTQTPEMSFCGTSACSLKASLQIFISAFYSTDLSSIEELSIRCDNRIVSTPVNPNYLFDFLDLWSLDICDDVQKDSALSDTDSCGIRFVELISLKIRRDPDGILLPSRNSADANHLGIGVELEGVVIQPNRTMILLDWSLLELESLEHIACLVSDSSHKAAIEFRICLPHFVISELVQPCLVESFGFHPNIYAGLAGLICQADCPLQVIVTDDFRHYCELHISPLKRNISDYLNFSEVMSQFPTISRMQCPIAA